jgi:ATP-dependent RNA helicase RhlE
MSFADLGLKPELLRAVDEKGYSVPTPIQVQAIPAVLAGRDVLAGAQTGTGKTAAFVLPILQKLDQAAGRAPRALVLTPTRELTAQVADSARAYGKYVGVRTVVVFGGVSINPQIDALRDRCDLLVATPGRLLDLAEQGALDLRSIECVVLDEADRMLDMGFLPAIRRVLKLLPRERQNLLFSATYSDEIRELAARILRNPAAIEVASRNATAERVDQQVYRVPKDHKRHLLAHLIDDGNWHQVLVFTRTKHGANRLTQQLESNGIRAAAIHGNKSQGARVRALSDFKSNKITALVATEVAARGLDIKELPHVVNYELPNVPEDYVHRIGRTARAGGSGSAVSLVSPDEAPLLKDIERMLRRTLPVAALPDFQIVATRGATSSNADTTAGEELPSGRAEEDRRAFGRRRGGYGHSGDRGADHRRQGDRRGNQHGRSGRQADQHGRPGRQADQGADAQGPSARQHDRRGPSGQHRDHRGQSGQPGDQRESSGRHADQNAPAGRRDERPGGWGRQGERHGDRHGRSSRSGEQLARPGRRASESVGSGRTEFRHGRPGQPSRQPSRGFSPGGGQQRNYRGGGRSSGRR